MVAYLDRHLVIPIELAHMLDLQKAQRMVSEKDFLMEYLMAPSCEYKMVPMMVFLMAAC